MMSRHERDHAAHVRVLALGKRDGAIAILAARFVEQRVSSVPSPSALQIRIPTSQKLFLDMFDRDGNVIKYTTQEEIMSVLTSDRLDPDLDHIFHHCLLEDAAC